MRKTVHLPHGCDKQGRYSTGLRSDFLTQPGAHLVAKRDSLDAAQAACAIEGPYVADEDHGNSPAWWLAAAALLVAFCAYAPLLAEVLQ